MKKLLALLLMISIFLGMLSCLSGCKNQKVHMLTRGEWAEKLADSFGWKEPYEKKQVYDDVDLESEFFNAVTSGYEWEIYEKSDKFEPNERADVEFAVISSVKAIGLDNIANSVGGSKLSTDKEIVKYFKKNCTGKYSYKSALYDDVAQDILNEVNTMYHSLTLKNEKIVDYKENVKTFEEKDVRFLMDKQTLEVLGDKKVAVGDIVVIAPSSYYPSGKYAKVVSVNGKKATYEIPAPEEIFDNFILRGQFEAEVLSVTPLLDGVTITSIGGNNVVLQSDSVSADSPYGVYVPMSSDVALLKEISANLGDVEFSVDKTFKAETNPDALVGGSANITISGSGKLGNITPTLDIDMWKGHYKASVASTLESEISVSGGFEGHLKIFKYTLGIEKVANLNVTVYLKVGIEGSFSLVFSVDTVQGAEYKRFKSAKVTKEFDNYNLDVEAKLKGYIKIVAEVELEFATLTITCFGVSAGGEATAKTKIFGTSDDVQCVDLSVAFVLSIYVGAEDKEDDDSVLGKLGVQAKWNIFTASNSPLKLAWHVEDGEIVEKCTKGKDKDAKEGEEEQYEEKDPVLMAGGTIEIDEYFYAMNEGESDKLNITKAPEGYKLSDLTYSSSDPTIVSVDASGKVKANGAGSTLIKISTRDGKYSVYCAIKVFASYDVEFTPLSIWDQELVYDFCNRASV